MRPLARVPKFRQPQSVPTMPTSLWWNHLSDHPLVQCTDIEEEIVDAYLVSSTGLKDSDHLIRIFENNSDKLCDWLLLGQCDCFLRIMKIIKTN